MKKKFLFPAFILFLALLTVSLDNATPANQELVIRFSESNQNYSQTQETESLVRNKLEALSVNNLKVEVLSNGSLKVSYFSDLDSAKIKRDLIQALGLNFSDEVFNSNNQNSEFPTDNTSRYCKIDIYKIQDVHDFDGSATNTVEPKFEVNRLSHLEFQGANFKEDFLVTKYSEIIVASQYNSNTIALHAKAYKTPQTRAGPTA